MKSKKYLTLIAAALLTLAACGPKQPSSDSSQPGPGPQSTDVSDSGDASSLAPSSDSSAAPSSSASSDESSAPVGEVTAVKLNKSKDELAVGEELELEATVEGTGDFSQDVAWASENPAIATVDANGKVKAIAVG